MKKFGIRLLAVMVFIMFIALFGGCSDNKSDKDIFLEKINIKSLPLKLNYFINEKLNISGLVVEGIYTDGTTKDENVKIENITGFESKTTGKKELTITILNKIAKFYITVEDSKVKIAIIGDSISDGCNPEISTVNEGYAVRYGYAQMLEGLEHDKIEKPAKTIYNIWSNSDFCNFSITGSKAAEWNKDSSDSTKWHTWNKEFEKVLNFNPDVAVIYLGANDIFGYIYNGGGITTAEWDELKENLKGVVDQLQSKNKDIKIVMVGYYDMFDGCSKIAAAASPANFGPFADMSTIIIEGNKIINDIAEEEGATYVEIYSTFINHGYGLFLGNQTPVLPLYFTNLLTTFDIHPVTAGHKAIYEKVYSALETLK